MVLVDLRLKVGKIVEVMDIHEFGVSILNDNLSVRKLKCNRVSTSKECSAAIRTNFCSVSEA